MPAPPAPRCGHSASSWRYIFAGLCATLVSIGLARFAFTPLIPELIGQHWFSASTVVYLGAANLAGYVCGAMVGRAIGSWLNDVAALRLMMLLITAAFLACAFPVSVGWYFCWRFLSGLGGGVVMVLVAATVLPHVAPERKGAAGGVMFLGLGLGIAGSGTLVPLLLEWGLAQTWIGLTVVSALLTAVSWFAWPTRPRVTAPRALAGVGARFGANVRLVYFQYALMASAAVPPMVFLVDFIARGLGRGTHVGAMFWAIYGVGAMAGPPLYGYLADALGGRLAVRLVCLIIACVLATLWASEAATTLALATLVVGTFAPGMVPLMLARVHEVVADGAGRQNIAWTRASSIAAAGMALTAYGFSALFSHWGGEHRPLFLIGAAVLLLTLLIEILSGRRAARRA